VVPVLWYGTLEFDDPGLMRRRIASINKAKIAESDRRLR
jgi:nuclear transport factor 2 (NTF2) superfamily protein